jgi:hypothetical protein
MSKSFKLIGIVLAGLIVFACKGPQSPVARCEKTPSISENLKPEEIIQSFYKDCSSEVDSKYFEESVVTLAEKVRSKYKDAEGVCLVATCADVRYFIQDGKLSDLRIGPFDANRSMVDVQWKLDGELETFLYELKLTPKGWKISDIHFPPERHNPEPSLVRLLNENLNRTWTTTIPTKSNVQQVAPGDAPKAARP